MPKFVDLTGAKFGQLTAVRRLDRNQRAKATMWLCKCSCGKEKAVGLNNLRTGNTLSCGCTRYERSSAARRVHGMSESTEYRIWCMMKSRCYRESDVHYKAYGGRGIEVCERWRDSFVNFMEDMGPRPARHSLDRIDANKGYSSDNCRWADHKRQARNKRNNRRITAFGKTQCLADWQDETGVQAGLVSVRIKLGWTPERALTEPSRGKPRA